MLIPTNFSHATTFGFYSSIILLLIPQSIYRKILACYVFCIAVLGKGMRVEKKDYNFKEICIFYGIPYFISLYIFYCEKKYNIDYRLFILSFLFLFYSLYNKHDLFDIYNNFLIYMILFLFLLILTYIYL